MTTAVPRVRGTLVRLPAPREVAAGVACTVVAIAVTHEVRDRSLALVFAFLSVAALSGWCLTTRNPRAALVLVMVYIGLGDGFVKLRINNQPATLLRDVLLYAVLANLLLRRTRPTEGTAALTGTAGVVLAFVGLILAQTLHPNVGSALQAIGGVRLHLEFVPLFFVGFLYCRTERELTVLMVILVVIAVANSVVSIVQSGLTLDQFARWGPGYRDKLLGLGNYANGARVGFTDATQTATVRPFGLGSDIGFGAVAAALAIPSALALAMRARSVRLVGVCGAATVVCVAGVVIGGARVAIVTGVVGLVLFLSLTTLSRQALRAIGIVALFAALGALLLPVVFRGSGSSAFERFESLSPSKVVGTTQSARGGTLDAIPRYLVKYPVGAGVGQSGSAAQFAHLKSSLNAESEFTFLSVEAGIVGVGLLAWLNLGGVLRLLVGRRRILDRNRVTAVVAIVAPLAGLLPVWFTAPITAAPPYSAFFWLALGVGAYQLRRPERIL